MNRTLFNKIGELTDRPTVDMPSTAEDNWQWSWNKISSRQTNETLFQNFSVGVDQWKVRHKDHPARSGSLDSPWRTASYAISSLSFIKRSKWKTISRPSRERRCLWKERQNIVSLKQVTSGLSIHSCQRATRLFPRKFQYEEEHQLRKIFAWINYHKIRGEIKHSLCK